MTREEVLATFDQEQRRGPAPAGMRVEHTPHTVRLIDLHASRSCIVYSRPPAGAVDATILAEKQFFQGLGHSFEWKVYGHDQPDGLAAALERHGFLPDPEEALVILDLVDLPAALSTPPAHPVRSVRSPADLEALQPLFDEAWRTEGPQLAQRLSRELVEIPETLHLAVTSIEGTPCSIGWMYARPGEQFVTFWGGSTAPRWRRRGAYTALVAARVQEARMRGARWATVEALPTSRPILQRLGFQEFTRCRGYVWTPAPAEPRG